MPAERFLGTIDPKYAVNLAHYDGIRAAKPNYRLVQEEVIPPHNGRAFLVKQGHTIRICTVDGPQVSDVAFWNATNPTEFFDAERTFVVDGWYMKPNSRLWSQIPFFRPIATCLEDTVVQKDLGLGYHHHFVGSHCAPEMYELRHGQSGLNACHLMLLQGIEPFGLTEANILHNLNLHQKVRFDPDDGFIYCAAADSRPGDYIEFYAEIDLIIACSVCPNGPGVNLGLSPETDELYPIGVEIYDTGIAPLDFPGWTDWRPSWLGKWSPGSR